MVGGVESKEKICGEFERRNRETGTEKRSTVRGVLVVFFLMIGGPPRSTQSRSSTASDVYKRQPLFGNCARSVGVQHGAG